MMGQFDGEYSGQPNSYCWYPSFGGNRMSVYYTCMSNYCLCRWSLGHFSWSKGRVTMFSKEPVAQIGRTRSRGPDSYHGVIIFYRHREIPFL